MKKTILVTSITALMAFAAANSAVAKSTVTISTPDGVEDWATSALWTEGVPTIADDANVTSDSSNNGTLEINSGTAATAKTFGVDDYAKLLIKAGGSLELASGQQLFIGNNASVTLDGGTLTAGTIAVNFGTFTANAGSIINSNFNYASKSTINITGSTINAAGSNFFGASSGAAGDVATATYDSSIINGNSGSLFFINNGLGKKVFNFNNGTTVNAYNSEGLDADGFVTSSGQNVRIGWSDGDTIDVEVNVNSGSALYTGAFDVINTNGSGIQTGNVVFNMSGTSGNISKISTTSAVLGLGTAAGNDLQVGIKMTGHSDFKSNSSLTIGANNNATGGRAYVEISGTDNKITTKGNLSLAKSNGGTGGASELIMAGSNNVVEVGGIEMGNYNQNGTTGLISVTGPNTLQVSGSTTIGWGDQLATGFNRIYAKGQDASNKTYLKLDGTVNIWGTKIAGSDGVNELVLDGSVDLQRIVAGNWATVNIGTQSGLLGGTARMTVRGSDNFVGIWNLSLGNADQTGGQSVLRIEGAGSEIRVNNNLVVKGAVGASRTNLIGGMVEFALTDEGISKLFAANVSEFAGILTVDFSLMQDRYESGATFELISSSASLKAVYDALVADDRLNIILRAGDDANAAEFSLSDDEKQLFVKYTSSIPEPSTYAALFGVLALSIAAYRRRK